MIININKNIVAAFAITIGKSIIKNPYTNQLDTPIKKISNHQADKSLALLNRQTFITCGIKDTVVKTPAKIPI